MNSQKKNLGMKQLEKQRRLDEREKAAYSQMLIDEMAKDMQRQLAISDQPKWMEEVEMLKASQLKKRAQPAKKISLKERKVRAPNDVESDDEDEAALRKFIEGR